MSTHTVTRTAVPADTVLSDMAAANNTTRDKHPLTQPVFSTSCAIEYLPGKEGGFAITERVVLHSSKRRSRK